MELGGQQQFAKAHYYFQMHVQNQTKTLAQVTKYSDTDAEIVHELFGTLWVLKNNSQVKKHSW